MAQPINRGVVAVGFAVLFATPSYLDALFNIELWESNVFTWPYAILLLVGMGFLIGRWWALLVLLAPVLLVLPLGNNPDDADSAAYAGSLLLGLIILGVPLTSGGALARWGVNASTRQRIGAPA